MATTQKYRVKPDYYSTKEECVSSTFKKVNTNPRYKHFKQTHFTAGDTEQFQDHRDFSNGQICIPHISLENNLFRKYNMERYVDWVKYHNIDPTAVMNTFYYIFNKFKKGIFIRIRDNQLSVFLPFSKKDFVNEWSDRIKVDPKYGNILNFIKYINSMEKRKFFPKSINGVISHWYSNNCLVRYEYPINEGDTNNPNMSDMFSVLCRKRKLPDVEFFLNRRDFPIIKKDGTEAYEDMFGSSTPLVSHSYSKYAPILSMVTKEKYADIPIPTGEDWARIGNKQNKFFPKSCREYNEDFTSVPWNKKKPIAVFRGGSTGCGVTIETNNRLKLAHLSKTLPKDSDGNPFLDAGITNWNLRPRKLKEEKYLQTIDINSLGFGTVNRLTPQEQAEYKYLVHVDGHVSAFRLSLELGMGCCILKVDSEYKMWYSDLLKPYKHYIPIKRDLSNLVSTIKWCKANDDKCRRIAKRARKFHDKYLGEDGILDYLQKLLFKLKEYNGIYLYNTITPFELQISQEKKLMLREYPNDKVGSIVSIPDVGRCFGLLKGMHWIINMLNEKNQIREEEKGSKIFENKNSRISECLIANFSFISKTSKTEGRKRENIHESFIGTNCINPLVEQVPNFVYHFGLKENSDNSNSVLLENIAGITFSEYFKDKDFSVPDFAFILSQISIAIHIAQEKCAFVHNDLTPWNIMLQTLPEPVKIDYKVKYDTTFRVITKIIPVIIDYGKSHAVFNNKHYGVVNMFSMNPSQDSFSILALSLLSVLQRYDLTRKDISDLIYLGNFLLKGNQTFKHLGELKTFLRRETSFDKLVLKITPGAEKQLTIYSNISSVDSGFRLKKQETTLLSWPKGMQDRFSNIPFLPLQKKK